MCFGVDGVDELDEVGELVEAVVVVGGIEADTEGADAGVAVEAESFDDTFVVANEIGVESDGGGDSGASGSRSPASHSRWTSATSSAYPWRAKAWL